MQKLTTATFSPFVRPCKVFFNWLKGLLTLLPGFPEAICFSFCHVFEPGHAKPQLQWSGERGEDAITVSAP